MSVGPYLAVIVSVIACLAWLVVLVATLRGRIFHRRESVMMPVAALLASIGSLASAVWFSIQQGLFVPQFDPQILTLVASMGSGALAAAGLIVLTHRDWTMD